MNRQPVVGLVSHLAAIFPHDDLDQDAIDHLVEQWSVHLRQFDDEDIDEITAAIDIATGTWDEDRIPPPVVITTLVRRRRQDATARAAVAEARAVLAAARTNPAVPSMRRTA